MCLTPRQYNTTERLTHNVWKTKILQKQMTEIMEDLDECVSNGKYTDGEYLALSKEIKLDYEKYGKLEKLFMEIQETIKRYEIRALERFDGDVLETLKWLGYPSLAPNPKIAARRAEWLERRQLKNSVFQKEQALTELIVTTYGDDVVENVLEDEGWERQTGVVDGGWELTHELGIQFDDLLENHELYAQRREEGQYYIKEMYGL